MIRVSTEEDCPTNDFIEGEPAGKCWGDGHYKCNNCVLFRADFKADHKKKDLLLRGQSGVHVISYEEYQRRFR